MAGDGEGLVVGEGVGCGVGARGQAGELGHSLLGHPLVHARIPNLVLA